MANMIESVARITHVTGHDLIICPKCYNIREQNKDERVISTQKKGFRYKINCEVCKHPFTLHEGLLQRRLLYRGLPYPKEIGKISVMPYNPFTPSVCVSNFEFKVGLTKRLDLSESLSEIYYTIVYEQGTDKGILIEIRFVTPNILDVVSSASNESDLGKDARFTIINYGTFKEEDKPVWKRLMAEALSLINKTSYKSSIIQSHAGFEAFLADFVKTKLIDEEKWDKKTFENYIIGSNRDTLPFAGILKVVIDQILGIKLIHTEFFKDWEGTEKRGGAKSLRNALAHGDIQKYEKILSQRNFTEAEAGSWVFETILKMIYYIKYYQPE